MKEKNKLWMTVGIFIVVAMAGIFLWRKTGGDTAKISDNSLKVTLFKVGKADAIVLEKGGHTMVIDAGEEEDGEEVVRYLESQGIHQIEELIITHYDKDHVGGADTVLEAFDVKRVILPDYEGDTVEYYDFMTVLNEKKIPPEKLRETLEFEAEGMKVMIEPPLSYEAPESIVEMDNNFSLITTVVDGENKLVFMGDAEKQRVREWMKMGHAQKCDFLKIPHHGIYETALDSLIEVLRPQCAAICSSHKHPSDEKTLKLLKRYKVAYFETKDGNITLTSDGEGLEMDQTLEK